MKIVVIGGGPAGRSAAMEASKLEAEVTLIEKDKIGGKCLHQGCMVVCGLNEVAKFYLDSQNYQKLDICNNITEINFPAVIRRLNETTENIKKVLEYETQSTGVDVITGEAQIQKGSVLVSDDKVPYDKLIIATGSRAMIPPIKGVEHALTYADIPYLEDLPEKLLIVGSGVIAAEFANIFSSFGTEVRIFCRNKFLKMLDPEIKDYVINNLLQKVQITEYTQVDEITDYGIETSRDTVEGQILLATGLIPNSEITQNMVKIGDHKEILVNPHMQTSNPHIYAAGDVIGGVTNTPISRMEGVIAARNACGISSTMDYSWIPQSISLYYDVSFLSPQDHQIGTEATIPGSAGPGSFWRVLEGKTGMTKVSVDLDEGSITGISSVSPSSRNNIAYLAKMIRDGYKTPDFDDFLEVHPSNDVVYKLLRFFGEYS
ncbi:MAG TPA: NAD(P)/FAD-dependent oxidoreductase [Methanobacteriaceae archaeon]|nr:NAD(P)/FAD-dependent oxidoreductase [Methanobacteriaceae archaeon]